MKIGILNNFSCNTANIDIFVLLDFRASRPRGHFCTLKLTSLYQLSYYYLLFRSHHVFTHFQAGMQNTHDDQLMII